MEKKSIHGRNKVSRRDFLSAGLAVPALGVAMPQLRPQPSVPGETTHSAAQQSSMLKVNFQPLISRADLTYTTPVTRTEAGMPVGNGRMGSLVWTTPTALKFQINRADVFAEGRNTNSFRERHTDYGSGCGYVDIDFANFGADVFAAPVFRQHLGIYDALMTAVGKGVTVRVLAWNEHDVMAVEIEDQRPEPQAVTVDLRMLRYMEEYVSGRNRQLTEDHTVLVRHHDQTASSTIGIRDGNIVLIQKFHESDFYCSSAVAIAVVGRKSKAKYANTSTMRLTATPGPGRFTILIASAASFDPNEDVAALALNQLEAGSKISFPQMLKSNRGWWHDFWTKSFVHLTSSDGEADFVEQNYTYFLYMMASSSRGKYPPRFGGMLWFTNGDMREWGSQHWWANDACYYNALPPLNRFELMDPMFDMYTKMYSSCARAAREQWGSQGIFIPETTWFDGLDDLPADLVEEVQALYLMRKPWDQRSVEFQHVAEPKQPHNSRWNWKDKGTWEKGRWVFKDKGAGPFGQTSHILSSGAKIAYLYWLRYDYTRDQLWLRDRAYPMLKGIAELYRNFPGVKKEADGKYHIHNINNHEPVWGAQDTNEEVSAMHGILPLAIRASEILGVDLDLRSKWVEFHDNLTPITTNDSPGALNPRQPGQPSIWIAGLPPVLKGQLGRPGPLPILEYDLCTVSTADPATLRIGNNTYNAGLRQPMTKDTPVSVLNHVGTAAAHLGRAKDLRFILPNQLRCLAPQHDFCDWIGGGKSSVLANRLTLREGPGAIGCERIGRVSQALHAALLQSSPESPGGKPVLHIFPAFPKEWNAQYTLLARGAFLVTSSVQNGEVEFVEVVSKIGGQCRLRNPWGQSKAILYRNGNKSEESSESFLIFSTARDEDIVVVRAGTMPEQFRRTV